MITENLSTLKIHKLTQEQYDRELQAGRIDPNALYLTPDKNDINIYIQNEAPTGVENGSLWVDMDAVSSSGSSGGGSSSGGGDYSKDEIITEIKSYVDSEILGGAW